MTASEITRMYMRDGDRLISALDENLQYEGRIDFTGEGGPVWVYPATYVRMRFTGNRLSVVLSNFRAYWDNYIGYLLDGTEHRAKLPESGTADILLWEENEADAEGDRPARGREEHELLLFKRQDSCHMVQIHGFIGSSDAELRPCPPLPARRIEVYGDSVSAGEVSEAVDYCGLPDPDHNGEYSNSYYSYAWITARRLGARLHDIAQGGIALMDGCGYFMEPRQRGMESMYDCIQYQPQLLDGRPAVRWDFNRYRPQVVIVALGQNDAHPDDFCGGDYEGEKAAAWREHYGDFVRKLCRIHPQAVVICMTTILGHHPNWDRAIGEVCAQLKEEGLPVRHFLFSDNGCGTRGHIRIPEAERMAEELAAYIDGMGEDIWRDTSRLQRVMERAAAGENITIGFLGGSITQGSLASEPGKCYAALTFDWWRNHFPVSAAEYVNAGIGGTTSHFGAARAEEDLLSHRPDVVFVEFSVNDTAGSHFMETYEGLIRRILSCDWKPAVVLIHNRFYDTGASAQAVHDRIGRYYELPRVCVGDVLYGKICSGGLTAAELTPDGLHPNDRGHRMIAEMICGFLAKVDEKRQAAGRRARNRQEILCQEGIGPNAVNGENVPQLPAPMTRNRYEHARRLCAADIIPAKISGFEADPAPRQGITDIFKGGWTALQNGAEITFRFRASCIAIQYRRTIRGLAPRAEVWLDCAGTEDGEPQAENCPGCAGMKVEPQVILDGNFDETWGDCLALETILEAETEAEHTLTLRIADADGAEIPFYLVSLIAA